ncbi:glycosyltransferase [Pontibacter indicus]|uniref:Glycosyltransferase involved in cell wall bisynthesis n=1 Tax=Pontibacter indicus TaxID=1317125 RepID=A0A1R3XPL6_9BACT|nr:glycosyltransferase [Pontibacter indicus]SIT93818.1 Glycosyltransferase involved in cell wall bisynthesis [Pontibacter indicus]
MQLNAREETPVVSVWMITYNHEKFIRQSIESVLMQKTNFPIELVIGEDCSTDGTRKIIEELEQKYPQVIKPVYHKSNVGAARNAYEFCLPKLKGKYVACLEGDDYWMDPFKLQKQVDFLEANPDYILSFHDCKVVDRDNKVLKEGRLAENFKKDLPQESIILGSLIPTNTVLFRNRVITCPKEIFSVTNNDTFLFALLGQHGKAKFSNDVQPSAYRVHDGGIWSSIDNLEKRKSGLNTYEQLYKVIDSKYKHLIKKALFTRRLMLIKQNKSVLDSIKYYINSYNYFYFGNGMYKTWLKSHYDLLKQLYRN